MNIKQIIIATVMTLTALVSNAQEWNTSVGVSIGGPNGQITIGTSNGGVTVHGGVIIPPQIIYPAPHVIFPQPQQVLIVPCYNCGQYPQGNQYDPYRNHHHLQRPHHHVR